MTCLCDCMAILFSCPFPLPRLCCQMMGWASGWESQTPLRSLSPCKHLFPLTNFGWAASVLTLLITSGWRVPAARAPHPGPTGFPWRRQREVRRGWGEGGRCSPLPRCTLLTSVPPLASPLTHLPRVASISFPSSALLLSTAPWHLSQISSLCFLSWETCTSCPCACPLHPAPTSCEERWGSGRGASFTSSLCSSAPGSP